MVRARCEYRPCCRYGVFRPVSRSERSTVGEVEVGELSASSEHWSHTSLSACNWVAAKRKPTGPKSKFLMATGDQEILPNRRPLTTEEHKLDKAHSSTTSPHFESGDRLHP